MNLSSASQHPCKTLKAAVQACNSSAWGPETADSWCSVTRLLNLYTSGSMIESVSKNEVEHDGWRHLTIISASCIYVVHMKEHPCVQTCTKEEEVKMKEEEMLLLSSYSCLLIALRGKSTSAIETKLRF